MYLPTIRLQTWKRICTKEMFCDRRVARACLEDTLAKLKPTNPYLFSFLKAISTGEQEWGYGIKEEISLDAAACGASLCRLFRAQASLPFVSGPVYDKVLAEALSDLETFWTQMNARSAEFGQYVVATIALWSMPYETNNFATEALVVSTTGFMVYRMLELQAGINAFVSQ